MAKILQLNTNHSGFAQDNLLHLMEEMDAGLAIIAESHKIPQRNSKWITSTEDPPTAAIKWRKCKGRFLPPRALERGRGFCFVE